MMTIKRNTLAETFRIALPAIAESLFTAIIGFVDSFMVSSLAKHSMPSLPNQLLPWGVWPVIVVASAILRR